MHTLAIARHGIYDHKTELLSSHGQDQMRILASLVRHQYANEDRVRLLSSSAIRARDSSRIFAEVLGIEPEFHDILWSGTDSPGPWMGNAAKVVDLVQGAQDADVVILMTHLEYTESLPREFGHRVLQTQFLTDEVEKGQAWVIDCIAKTCTRLSSGR